MPFFTAKPAAVEAMQNGSPGLIEWITSHGGKVSPGSGLTLHLETRTGTMRVEFGDWVIRRANGDFSVCPADMFPQTYDEVGVTYLWFW